MTVTCRTCHRPMDGSGCTDERAHAWGSEPWQREPIAWTCSDCGVLPGGRHHAGCCVAICADCGEQLLLEDLPAEPVPLLN